MIEGLTVALPVVSGDWIERKLSQVVRRAQTRTHMVALVLLEIDQFRAVRLSLNADGENLLLRKVRERLSQSVKPGETLVQLASEEFALMTAMSEDAVNETAVAERLRLSLYEPFAINGEEIYLTASVGVVIWSGTHGTAKTLLRDALRSVEEARVRGRDVVVQHKPGVGVAEFARLTKEWELRRAVRQQEFTLHYQPILALCTGKVEGVEALIRWLHPERGLIAPIEFIPLAEEIGLIDTLGQWVLREACQQMQVWRRTLGSKAPPTVSVNLSPRQLMNPRLFDVVAEVLRETGVEPSALQLEITENGMVQDMDAGTRTLQRLRDLGVHLALDDFGSGHSALHYLKRFPIDVLKLDRLFVSGLPGDRQGVAIVEAVLGLGRSLDLMVIAEGIEEPGQAESLRRLGCHFGQGYHLAMPWPVEEVETWLRERAVTQWPSESDAERRSPSEGTDRD